MPYSRNSPDQGSQPLARTWAGLLLAVVTVLAAACQDAATGPTSLPEVQSSLGQGAGAPFYCATQVQAPGGYRKGHFVLSFPQSALAPDGESMRYRFRATGKDGRIRALADCVIPRTVPAVEGMNRRFGLPPRTGLPAGGGRPDQEMTVTSESYCSEDVTEGCTIVGDPSGGETDMEPTCDINTGANCDEYSGGGEGDGGGGGGGLTPEEEAEIEAAEARSSTYDGTGELLECPKPASGVGGYTEEHCNKIESAISYLKNHSEEQCRKFGQSADYHFHTGKSYFYWTTATEPGTYGGFAGGELGLTPLAFEPGELANTIAHEEAHRLGWPDRYNEDGTKNPPGADGKYASDWGRICSSSSI